MKEGRIKIGIFAFSLLAMGAIGVNSALADLAAQFQVSDTEIALMASIPCIVVIIVTLFLGKVLEHFSQKKVGIFGAICFLAGGLLPLILNDLYLIYICRAVTGIGIAISQVFMGTLTAEFFDEEKRPSVQGLAQAAQSAGMALMCLLSGLLAAISWRACFWIHLIGFFGLFAMIFFIPERKPQKTQNVSEKEKARLTPAAFGWYLVMFFVFLLLLVFANNLSFLLVEKGIGSAADAGITLAIYAIGGLLTGAVYGKIDKLIGVFKLPLAMLLFTALFLLAILSKNMVTVYIGAFIGGIALSLFFPQVILYTGLSVAPSMIATAVSLLTCAQNLGQILCPYATNPLAALFSNDSNAQISKLYISLIGFAILTVIMLLYALRKKRQGSTS